jgi:hypothetical protein
MRTRRRDRGVPNYACSDGAAIIHPHRPKLSERGFQAVALELGLLILWLLQSCISAFCICMKVDTASAKVTQ